MAQGLAGADHPDSSREFRPPNHSHRREVVAADKQRLKIVLVAVAIYCAAEFIGGYFTNSLALMTDAVHMLTDIAALSLGLLTLWISTRPASGGKTFGYLRAEILGAFLNGIFLWLLVAFIWIEAFHRLHHPLPSRRCR